MFDKSFMLALFDNFQILIALTVISQVINRFNFKKPFFNAVLYGLIFGCVGLSIMMFPFVLTAGITFDSRSILLSIVGLFYPGVTTIITTIIIMVYRIYLGGSGVYMGIAVILTSATLGYIWRNNETISKFKGKWYYYFSLGIVVHLFMLGYMYLLPHSVQILTIKYIGLPVLLFYPVVTIIIGKLFNYQFTLLENIELIKQGEMKWKNLYDSAPIGILYSNENLEILSTNVSFCLTTGYSHNELMGKKLVELVVENNQQTDVNVHLLKLKESESSSFDCTLQRKDLSTIWTHVSISKNSKNNGQDYFYIITLQNINDRKENEILSNYLVYRDHLTGAYNLRYLKDKEQEWKISGDYPSYILCIDISSLKLINDVYGFEKGDELLLDAYKILSENVADKAEIIRIKSNEFLLYTTDKFNEEISKLVNIIQFSFHDTKMVDIEITISIGVAQFDANNMELFEVIKLAEDKMLSSKLHFYDLSLKNTVNVLMKSLYAKNSREMIHSNRVSIISKELALMMNLDKYNVEKARIAGLVHDIGKIGIPDRILNKATSLTIDEYKAIKEHSLIGYKILNSSIEFSEISEIILSHHERWDGNGYPRGLKEETIPLIARILAIADSFDAIISERPYRKALNVKDAIMEIDRNAGSQFDPEIAAIFTRMIIDK